MRILLLFALGSLSVSCAGYAGHRMRPATFDLQAFIDDRLAAGDNDIVIPSGRYLIAPSNRRHLVLRDLEGVTIDAGGVEMICTQTTRAIDIVNCRNLVIRGLVIDYDPLPFTQGRIVALSADTLVADIELFDGYPRSDKVVRSKYEIFRDDTRTLRFGSYYGFKVEMITPTRLRITKTAQYRDGPERVGDIAVINASDSPDGEIPHAVYMEGSDSVTLEDVTLYASNCFGFFEVDCSASRYVRCIVDRRPAGKDLKSRADPRVRSLNADAFHSKVAQVGPSYRSCTARFQGDDCVAISGSYHMITAGRGGNLRVLAKQGAINISPGDRVELVTYEGARIPDARVVSLTEDGVSTDEEGEFLSGQRMHAPMKAREHGFLSKAYSITLDRAVDLPIGSLICSADRIGNGFKVVDCVFGFNRSRGILVKAGNGTITGNRLEGCFMPAIILSPEYWWLEAGSSDNVTIADNLILNCHDRAIAVAATAGNGAVAPAGVHNRITITDNTVTNCPAPQIQVTSTNGLVIHGNRLPTADEAASTRIIHCEDVQKDIPRH